MNIAGIVAILALLASRPAWADEVPKLPCADTDRQCANDAMKNHVARRLDTWETALSLRVSERIGPAPPQLVEYINLDNIKNGYPERPRAAKLSPDLQADVNAAIADLPPKIWALFGKRLVGLYFVEGLGGTAYTDYVLDRDGRPVAAFTVFDAAVLAKAKANAWATWKENTPFKPDATYKLIARIEADRDDNRKNAIQYILLHELGHVLSVGTNMHPPWDIAPKDVERGTRYPFFNLSWTVNREANRYESIFDRAFPQRLDTVYYFGAKLSATDMATAYANLENTNFASLYAATRPGDDFAESFATYVHVVLMKRPWQVEIAHDGKVVSTLKPCWSELRCAKKKEILTQLLMRTSNP